MTIWTARDKQKPHKVTNNNSSSNFTNTPIHGNGGDVNYHDNRKYIHIYNIPDNFIELLSQLEHLKKTNRSIAHPLSDQQNIILYLVGPSEPVSVEVVFSGDTKQIWNFNSESRDKARFKQTINAKDDEEVVILHIYSNGSRNITRVRKDSDQHIEIFNNQNQVITVEYDGGQTVLPCNYQTVAEGKSISGRKYKVSGEIQTEKLFGDHLHLTAENCEIMESKAFYQSREEMLELCPGLQHIYTLRNDMYPLYFLD